MARNPVRSKPPLPVIPLTGLGLSEDLGFRMNNDRCWQASNTMMVSRVAHVDTLLSSTAAISNTIALTFFSKTFTIQAGDLNYLGAGVRWSITGSYSRTTSTNITIRTYVDATNYNTWVLAGLVNQTGFAWSAQSSFFNTATGTASPIRPGTGFAGLGGNGAVIASQRGTATFNIDLTVAHTLQAAVQWQAAAVGDTIQIDGWTVEFMYPSGTTA